MRRPAASPALLLAGLIGLLAAAPPVPAAESRASDPAAVRQALWAALNQERARSGAPPLALQPALERVAQARAEEIGRHGSLSGERGEEERTRRLLEAAGYRAEEWVESTVSSTDDLAALVRTWRRPFLVVITGYGLQEDRNRSREAGFDVHLVKPVDSATLAEVLERR